MCLIVVIGLFLLPAACNRNTSSTKPTSNDPILPTSDPWGGYTATDEGAFFAEESHTMPYEGDDEGEDETGNDDSDIGSDSGLLALLGDPNMVVYVLRVDWGQLAFNPNHTTEIDWAGSISTTRGAVLVRRLYRFEYFLQGDQIIRPRTDIETVSWSSKTTVHHDGLLVAILTLPDDNANTTEVTFSTAYNSCERTFTLADLEAVNVTVNADDAGNKIAFNGCRTELGQLIDGVFGGRWNAGAFIGRWITLDGTPLAKFAGVYGINPEGKYLYFGKMVNMDGTFRGMMKGGWIPIPWTFGFIGWTLGVYTDENLDVVGLTGGHYIKAIFLDGGWLRGVWHDGLPPGWDPNNPPPPDPEDDTTPTP
jgi:hypothetical protein